MTEKEAMIRYGIPPDIIKEYKTVRKYDKSGDVLSDGIGQTDIERISLMVTLHDVGFSENEILRYMQFTIAGDDGKRLEMLESKRSGALNELHLKQDQLDKLDYLRFKIKK